MGATGEGEWKMDGKKREQTKHALTSSLSHTLWLNRALWGLILKRHNIHQPTTWVQSSFSSEPTYSLSLRLLCLTTLSGPGIISICPSWEAARGGNEGRFSPTNMGNRPFPQASALEPLPCYPFTKPTRHPRPSHTHLPCSGWQTQNTPLPLPPPPTLNSRSIWGGGICLFRDVRPPPRRQAWWKL